MLDFTVNVNDPKEKGLLIDFSGVGRPQDTQDFIRNDAVLAYRIRPVIPSTSGTRPWDDDGLDTDTYQVAIGLTDDPPTSGSWPLTIGATTITESWDVSSSVLQTALSASWATEGYTGCTVTQLSPQTFRVTGTVNGAVPSMTSGVNTLSPDSVVSIVVENAGDVSSKSVQIVQLRQSPVAYDEPATLLPAAGITSTVAQAGSSTANKIYSITLNADGTYSGTASISITLSGVTRTVGVYRYGMAAPDVLGLLLNYPGSTSDDFSVTISNNVITVEFTGAYALSNSPALSVSNIDLLAPKGVSGAISLNTFPLANAFYATSSDELTYLFAIRRIRASGENREILQVPVTLKRNIIDNGTMVPVTFPSFLTKPEADGYYQSKNTLLDDYVSGTIQGSTLETTGNADIGGDISGDGDANIAGTVFAAGGNFDILQVNSSANITGVLTSADNITILTAGKGLQIKEGSNAKQGTSTLSLGVCTVATTAVFSTSHVFLQHRALGGTPGILTYTIIDSTSFTVTSSNLADTSTFDWLITDPS